MTLSPFYEEENIVEIRYYMGDCVNDLVTCFNELLQKSDLPGELNILSHAVDCNIKFKYGDIALITNMMNLLSQKCNLIKHAIVTDSPHHTAMMALTKKKAKILHNYQIEIFCTKEAAYNYLL